jgi:DNA primase
LCPFHSEKTPSFFVFPEQGTWHCFGSCGTGGDIYSFIMKKEGLDFGQALRLLADRLGIVLDQPAGKDKDEIKYRDLIYEINEIAANYFHELLLSSNAASAAGKYLQSRGVAESMIHKFVIGYCRDSYTDLYNYLSSKGYETIDILAAGLIFKRDDSSLCDRFRNRIIFPIWDYMGKVIGFGARSLDGSLPKYINSPQTIVFDKSNCLYGIDKAKDAMRHQNQVIITEGYMDVITSHQYGWDYTVATMGTALTEKHLAVIKKYTKNLILAMDSDEAGAEASLRIAESVDIENYMNSDVRVVLTPQGKDPDEVIKLDVEAWKNALANAELLIDYVMKLIKTKYDLNTPNGKTQAIDKFIPVVTKIKDNVRKWMYITRFAKTINIDEKEFIGILGMARRVSPSKMRDAITSWKKTIESPSLGNLEDDSLGLVLQFPELRAESKGLHIGYFEKRENLEIFAKWLKYDDFESLRSNLDPLLHSHLDDLMHRHYPPLGSGERIKRIFYAYASRLRERYHRRMEAQKAVLLTLEAETGVKLADLAKLEEQGALEAMQLKEVYQERSKRREIASQ